MRQNDTWYNSCSCKLVKTGQNHYLSLRPNCLLYSLNGRAEFRLGGNHHPFIMQFLEGSMHLCNPC